MRVFSAWWRWSWSAYAVAWWCRNSCWVELELVCSWCWWLRRRLEISANGCSKETRGNPQKTFLVKLFYDFLKFSQRLWMREQRWLFGSWHRLRWVPGRNWLDSKSVALAGSRDADPTFSSLLLSSGYKPGRFCFFFLFFLNRYLLCLYSSKGLLLLWPRQRDFCATVYRKFLY